MSLVILPILAEWVLLNTYTLEIKVFRGRRSQLMVGALTPVVISGSLHPLTDLSRMRCLLIHSHVPRKVDNV